MNLANALTLGRLLAVPIVIWAISQGYMTLALVLFVAAGVTDALDGWVAKRFDQKTELGAYLDPIADKALLVSIYVSLGLWGFIPMWFVILVVSRDVMIVGAVLLSTLVEKPVEIAPLYVSKLNTAAQIIFAALVLIIHGFRVDLGPVETIALWATAALTLASAAAYMRAWIKHISA